MGLPDLPPAANRALWGRGDGVAADRVPWDSGGGSLTPEQSRSSSKEQLLFEVKNRTRPAKSRRQGIQTLLRYKYLDDAEDYLAVLDACKGKGFWREAAQVLGGMTEEAVLPTRQAYLLAIEAATKPRSGVGWKYAIGMLRNMLDAGHCGNGPASSVAYAAVIEASTRASRWAHVLALLNAMQAKGIGPGAVEFSAAARACQAAGHIDYARSFEQAAEASGYLEDMSDFERDGLWEEALGLLEAWKAPDFPTTPDFYMRAMGACNAAGEWLKCLRLYTDFRGSFAKHAATSLSSTALVACRLGHAWQLACGIFAELAEHGRQRNEDWACLVSCCCESAPWEIALLAFSQHRPCPADIDSTTYVKVATACAAVGVWQVSLHLLDDMRSSGVAPDAKVLQVSWEACNAAGSNAATTYLEQELALLGIPNPSRAARMNVISSLEPTWQRTLEELQERKARGQDVPSGLLEQAFGQVVEADQWREAFSLILEMQKQDGARTAPLYGDVLLLLWKHARFDKMLAIIELMQESDIQVDQKLYSAAISELDYDEEHEKTKQWRNPLRPGHKAEQSIDPKHKALTKRQAMLAKERQRRRAVDRSGQPRKVRSVQGRSPTGKRHTSGSGAGACCSSSRCQLLVVSFVRLLCFWCLA
eukprot:TRINITY_DN39097_c0_g1_i1.p1 TRINITY_DN39097_c0_g1~~TRINITY_DN39097_c0_g1_i1.p1  ORF type:complete len:647 (+),score=74.23 TRINITY_DN39097_c0_g1_i1:187-2127(+)